MPAKLIIFDFFGVICSEIVPFWLNEYFSENEATRIKKDVIKLADRGQITQNELFVKLGKMAGITPKDAEDGWWKYVNINDDVVELIHELRKLNLDIALLSNAPAPFIRDIFTKYQLENNFNTIIISAEVKCAKPNQDIYDKLLSRTGYKPHQALFIDDKPENIRGAKSVGMNGILFKSFDDLEDNLISLDIYNKDISHKN